MPRRFFAFGSAKDGVEHVQVTLTDGRDVPVDPGAYTATEVRFAARDHYDRPGDPRSERWTHQWFVRVNVGGRVPAGDYKLVAQGLDAKSGPVGPPGASLFTLGADRGVITFDFPEPDYVVGGDERDYFLPTGGTTYALSATYKPIIYTREADAYDWDGAGSWWALFSNLAAQPGQGSTALTVTDTQGGVKSQRIVIGAS